MAVILDTGTEFSNSESPFHSDASLQVSAQPDVWRISRWPPSWTSEWNDFSNFEFLSHCDSSHQVSAQSDLGFRRRCRLNNFKMATLAAILDIGTEWFYHLYQYCMKLLNQGEIYKQFYTDILGKQRHQNISIHIFLLPPCLNSGKCSSFCHACFSVTLSFHYSPLLKHCSRGNRLIY